MERAKSSSIFRDTGESISSFSVRLRNGIRHCGFTGAAIDENLVEQFILGIKDKAIAKKLLEKEGSLTMNEAIKLAETIKLIEAGSSGSSVAVGKETSEDREISRIDDRKFGCFRCLKPGHKAIDKEQSNGQEM